MSLRRPCPTARAMMGMFSNSIFSECKLSDVLVVNVKETSRNWWETQPHGDLHIAVVIYSLK